MGLLWPERKSIPRAEWHVALTLKVGEGENALFLNVDRPMTFTDSHTASNPHDVGRMVVGKMADEVAKWEKQRRIPKGKKVPKEKKGEEHA